MNLELSNIVRVQVIGAEAGISEVNTSALAIITDDAPIPADYGDYGIYLSAAGVADDFGSNTDTYRLAEMIFSQKANVLTGKGYLVVIPRDAAAAAQPAVILGSSLVDLTKLTADDYNIKTTLDGGSAADIAIGEIDTTSVETVEDDLNAAAITSAGLVFTVSGELTSAMVTLASIATGAAKTIVIGDAGTGTDIAPLLAIDGSASGAATGTERVKDCILRTQGAVPYFGIVLNEKQTDALLTELAPLVQSLTKLLFVGSNLSADIAGIFTTLKDAGYTHVRCIYYSESEDDSLDFAAAYASRLMSIDFNASNTALTMHMKDITGLVADEGVTQTILDAAKNAGVDTYPNFGVGKVFCSGANLFADQIYTRLALQVDIQIAAFNFLATVGTKIPQTEKGMDGLKGACRKIMNRYVTAGVFAPGTWNGTMFGDPDAFTRNISDFGYYIYSLPIASQAQAERTARVAPKIQIAAKDAGAIHGADIIVEVEA